MDPEAIGRLIGVIIIVTLLFFIVRNLVDRGRK